MTTQAYAGGQAIVYLPGIDGSGALAAPFLRKAESQFPITQLHYPGHCRLTIEELADGCVAAISEKHPNGAIWLGDSFGSAVALSIALRHPSMNQGLILAGGFSKGPSRMKLLLMAHLWDRTPSSWRKGCVRASLMRLGRRNPDKITRAMVNETVSNGHLDHVSWRLRLATAFDVRADLKKIDRPLLYIGGEQDAYVNALEESRIFRDVVESSRSFLFPGCGHAVLAERPAECLELIDLFVPLARRVAA